MSIRAVLIARHTAAGDPVGRPGCLDLLVDRPCVQHVVEQLASAGVRELDVLAARESNVEAALGAGERWGISIRHHLPAHGAGVYDALPGVLDPAGDEEVLLAHADVLVGADQLERTGADGAAVVLFYRAGPLAGAPPQWTGWCRGSGRLLAGMGAVSSREELHRSLRAIAGPGAERECDALFVRDAAQLLAAGARLVSGTAPAIALRGVPGSGSVWKERGVTVHRTATLRGPLYLGEHVDVGAGAVLGPNVVVGAGSIVDREVTARECVIPNGTYIAPGSHCTRIVGLEGRGFWHVTGEPISGTLAASLIDMRSASLGAALMLWLRRFGAWIGAAVRAALGAAAPAADRAGRAPAE